MPDTFDLVYVHDPMCSWCWGFRPALQALRSRLPSEVHFRPLLGGLAKDSAEPMPLELQTKLQQTWHRIIERIPGTEFNFDFWSSCKPRRSTYPACRAVIAARHLDAQKEDAMILGIQQAYYLRAMNPSDTETLVRLAAELGLDQQAFEHLLSRDFIDETLQSEIGEARALGGTSFPSLILRADYAHYAQVPVDYTKPQKMLDTIESLIAQMRLNSAP